MPLAEGLGYSSGSGWWPPLAEAENNLTVGQETPRSLVTKPYFIETSSFYAGISEESSPARADLGQLQAQPSVAPNLQS